jgi:hypothetical protein
MRFSHGESVMPQPQSSENIGLNQRIIQFLREYSGQAPEGFVARELKIPESAVHEIVSVLVRDRVLERRGDVVKLLSR